jgi:hypothetical protein
LTLTIMSQCFFIADSLAGDPWEKDLASDAD